MSLPREPASVMLMAGLLYRPDQSRDAILARLAQDFGPVDEMTEPFHFDLSTYYAPEMGADLMRCFITFKHLVPPSTLADIKRRTNAIENEYLDGSARTVNIDPGMVTDHSLILATGKDFSHRIYLRDGIYAEVTLIAMKGGLEPLPWTYADYRLPATREFLNNQRSRLRAALRSAHHHNAPSL